MLQPTGYFKKRTRGIYLQWKDPHTEPPSGLPRKLMEIQAFPTADFHDMADFIIEQVCYRHPGYGIFIRDRTRHLFTDN